jgi:hypothetical protein
MQGCSFDGSMLTLYAHNPAQATTLRLASSDLLHILRQQHQLAQLCSIRIRIAVTDHSTPAAPAPPRILPHSTAALIGELAETALNPAIRDILRRLSRRNSPRNPN